MNPTNTSVATINPVNAGTVSTTGKYVMRERGYEKSAVQTVASGLTEFLQDPELIPDTNIRRDIRRSRRFVRGDQYVTVKMVNGKATQVPIAHGERGAIAHAINFIGTDGKKLAALMAARVPGFQITAKDPEDKDQARNAKAIELVMQNWAAENELKDEVLRVTSTMWDSGTVFTNILIRRTDKEVVLGTLNFDPATQTPDQIGADSEHLQLLDPSTGEEPRFNRYGFLEPANIDTSLLLETTDPEANRPSDTYGDAEYQLAVDADFDADNPAGAGTEHTVVVNEHEVVLYTTDMSEVTIPQGVTDIDACLWLRFDKRTPVDALVELYGKDAHFLVPKRTATSTTDTAQVAINVESTGNQYYETLVKIWVQPLKYNLLSEQEEAYFRENFPTGVVFHIVRGRILRLQPGNILEDWVAAKPNPQDRDLAQPSLASEIIGQQIIYNDGYNMAIRHLFSGIPRTIVDPALFSPNEIQRMAGSPFSIIRANKSMDMSRAMVNTPTATFPKDVIPFVNGVREHSREVSGLTPPVFGGGVPAPTFREASMRRDAAMAQIGLVFRAIVRWMRQVVKLAAYKMAKWGIQDVYVGRSIIRVHEDLEPHGWNVEVEEGIPMTDAETKDALQNVLSMNNPELTAALDLFGPNNRSRLFELMGLKGFRNSGDEQTEYCVEVLKNLLQTEPVKEGDQMYASVHPNPDLENPEQMIGFMRDWATRVDGGLRIKKYNKIGYQNVLLYLSEYVALTKQTAMMDQQAAAGVGPDGAPLPPEGGDAGPAPGAPPAPAPPADNPGGRPFGSERANISA